jgi:cytochrome oxidase Cu insertion factor (SCO1/SenC/PrrC family)
VEIVLASLFATFLYVIPVVRAATGPAIGSPAPDFVLRDQSDSPVRLSDLRGAPVLLVFYRGHW